MKEGPGSVYDKWNISMVICETDSPYQSTKSNVGDKHQSINQSKIDFPAELVELLKHADVEGKKFIWNLQVNDNTVTNPTKSRGVNSESQQR
jgi:hypothetical protein